jgi:hypothetical protein
MNNDEPQQTDWETEVGLSEETTYVAIYPSRKHAEQWMEEAEKQGYGSRSKYLYELIQETCAARQEGFLAYSQNESKVEELQHKVEQLQDDLENARNSDRGYNRESTSYAGSVPADSGRLGGLRLSFYSVESRIKKRGITEFDVSSLVRLVYSPSI